MTGTVVTALCGFLGAGKSTTLQHLLETCPPDLRIGVIANDVAQVNIDAQLVRDTVRDGGTGKIVSLQLDNGCACCTASDDVAASFAALLATSEDGFHHIVLETSGVAEANPMREVLKEVPFIKEGKGVLGPIVTVVDAHDFLAQYTSADALRARPDITGQEEDATSPAMGRRLIVDLLVEQVEGADVIVMNKVDLLQDAGAPGDAAALESILCALRPEATVHATSFGKVDLISLVHGEARGNKSETEHKHDDHDHDHDEDDVGTPKESKCCEFEGRGICDHNHDHDHGHGHDHDHDHGHGHDESHVEKLRGRHKTKYGIDSFVFKSTKPFCGPLLAKNVLKRMAAVQRGSSFPAFERLMGSQDSKESDKDDDADADAEAEADLESESDNPFSRVIRSKGFLHLQSKATSRMYWSHAGKHFAVTPKGSWHGDEENNDEEVGEPRQELVFIGVDMDKDRITQLLNESLAT